MNSELRLLTVEEVAEILDVSERSVYRFMAKKRLPYITSIRKQRLVLYSALVRWVEQQSRVHYGEEEERDGS